MKPLNIKAWPELTGYLPSASRIERKSSSEHDLSIDFSGCLEVSSTGLTVLLIRLIKYIMSSKYRRRWRSDVADSNYGLIKDLCFFKHLEKKSKNYNTLFDGKFNSDSSAMAVDHISFGRRKVCSMPIYCIDYNSYADERRNAIYEFRKMLKKVLTPVGEEYNIHTDQLIITLSEMAKNSADHTDDNAYFGMDLVRVPEKKSMDIHFVFGDLGCGIKKHIESNLPLEIRNKRVKHLSLVEAYYIALTRGFTSKPSNKNNRGIGMSIILDAPKAINMSLSVFDSYSRGQLSSLKDTTHEEIRRFFYSFMKDQNHPFFYYGVVEGDLM